MAAHASKSSSQSSSNRKAASGATAAKAKGKGSAKATTSPKSGAKTAAKAAPKASGAPRKSGSSGNSAGAKGSASKAKASATKTKSSAGTRQAAPAAKAKTDDRAKKPSLINGQTAAAPAKLSGFNRRQHQRLLELRDSLMDQMAGVARETLRSHPEGSEASAFGMHQADAGSDAYDRDFALNLLSKEQDALYEIEEALKRLEKGTYGVCEMSGKKIAQARLEAMPFARFTVECQAQIEREQQSGQYRVPVRSLFGLQGDGSDEEGSESLDDDKN